MGKIKNYGHMLFDYSGKNEPVKVPPCVPEPPSEPHSAVSLILIKAALTENKKINQ